MEYWCYSSSTTNVEFFWFPIRLLKALGASRRTRIYWAGGEPLGGQTALQPLMDEFSQLFSKGNLASPQELEPFKKKASSLAAIDYLVCLSSDVFLQSHGGNFGHVMQVKEKGFI